MDRLTHFTCTLFLASVMVPSSAFGVQITKAYFAAEPEATVAATISVYSRMKYQSRAVMKEGDLIRLGDVAKIYSRDNSLKQQLENLDLDRFSGKALDQSITRPQIEARIALAGIPTQVINLIGSKTVKVLPEKELADRVKDGIQTQNPTKSLAENTQKIVDAIKAKSASQFNVAPEAVFVTLQRNPVYSDVLPTPTSKRSRPSPGDFGYGNSQPQGKQIGRETVKIISDGGVWIGNRAVDFIETGSGNIRRGKVSVSILVQKKVLVATRPVSRGDLLSTDNSRLSDELFSSAAIEQAIGDVGWGRYATSLIRQGERIKPVNIGRNLQSTQVVIKSGDLVTLDFERNGLKLSMNECVARQSGRIGDFIKVESSINKKILIAKIVSPVRLLIR